MLKAQIVQDGVYYAMVSGNLVQVRVDEIVETEQRNYTGRTFGTKVTFKAQTRYRCTNLKTNRTIIVRSAARFRSPVKVVHSQGE